MGILKGWLPLSANPMISSIYEKYQQPLKKSWKYTEIFHWLQTSALFCHYKYSVIVRAWDFDGGGGLVAHWWIEAVMILFLDSFWADESGLEKTRPASWQGDPDGLRFLGFLFFFPFNRMQLAIFAAMAWPHSLLPVHQTTDLSLLYFSSLLFKILVVFSFWKNW